MSQIYTRTGVYLTWQKNDLKSTACTLLVMALYMCN